MLTKAKKLALNYVKEDDKNYPRGKIQQKSSLSIQQLSLKFKNTN